MSVFRKLMAASCFLVATMIAGCAAEAAQATTAVPLRLVAQWRMGGEGGWDLLAVYDPAGRVFVNIESEPGQIARIDLDSLTVGATWPLAGCDDPTGLAIDPIGHRLFSTCDAKVMAVTDSLDGRSGRIDLVTADHGPVPAATAEEPHPRPPLLPGTFRVLVVEPAR